MQFLSYVVLPLLTKSAQLPPEATELELITGAADDTGASEETITGVDEGVGIAELDTGSTGAELGATAVELTCEIEELPSSTGVPVHPNSPRTMDAARARFNIGATCMN